MLLILLSTSNKGKLYLLLTTVQYISYKYLQDLPNLASQVSVQSIEEHSKHRMKLPLYDLEPRTENNWIAPSATIIGEV